MARRVVVGRIRGAYGVRGWVKLDSYTDPPANILNYVPWSIASAGQESSYRVLAGRLHGAQVVAQLEGVVAREQAADLAGGEIAVDRNQLPQLPAGEFYWADLEGLQVELENGRVLGRVVQMLPTGSNDVLVVRGERERLVPFLQGSVVREVDLDGGRIVVDWDPEF